MRQHARKSLGFTLIELLVVVGIIALLISILLPALAMARKQARIAETTAELTGLGHSIDTYYTYFNAYPGPASYVTTTSNSSKISGTQNLLLGLSFGMVPVPPLGAPAGGILIPGPTSCYVVPTAATGPNDLANILSGSGASTVYRTYQPCFSPAQREISQAASGTTWAPAGVTGAASVGNTFGFPVILDRFPDAMPILYYRRNAGVDSPVAISSPGSNSGAYNYMDNIEYTTSTTLRASSGAVYNQSAGVATQFTVTDLTVLATSQGTSPASARGGYILISAGPDRFYGAISGKSDNIVYYGGQ